jgi:hypothetical protein
VADSETNVTNGGLCLKLHNSGDAKTITQGTSSAENRILLDYNFPITSTNALKYSTPGNPYGANSMTVSVYTGPLNHDSIKRSANNFLCWNGDIKNPIRNVMYMSTQGSTIDKVRFFHLVMSADGVLALYDSGDQSLPTTTNGVQSGQIQQYPNSIPSLANIVLTGTGNTSYNPKVYVSTNSINRSITRTFANTTATAVADLTAFASNKVCIYPPDSSSYKLTSDVYPYYTSNSFSPNPIPKPSFAGANYTLLNTPLYNSLFTQPSSLDSGVFYPNQVSSTAYTVTDYSAAGSGLANTYGITGQVVYYSTYYNAVFFTQDPAVGSTLYMFNISTKITTQIGGIGQQATSIDGVGTRSTFGGIYSITGDNNGYLYIFEKSMVRKVNPISQTW